MTEAPTALRLTPDYLTRKGIKFSLTGSSTLVDNAARNIQLPDRTLGALPTTARSAMRANS
jgi:hypothetical protein